MQHERVESSQGLTKGVRAIDLAVTTVCRPKIYIHELLSRLCAGTELRIVVGSPETGYLECRRSDLSIEVVRASPDDWDRFRDGPLQQRASWNYWRTLMHGVVDPRRLGLLVFEDDVVTAAGWRDRLEAAIDQIESKYGRDYVLSLYHTHLLTRDYAEAFYSIYPLQGFFGTQAIFYPEQVRIGFARYLKRNGVDSNRLPYDLLLKEFLAEQKIRLFATAPCLVQHIGTISTGLGFVHQARQFEEPPNSILSFR